MAIKCQIDPITTRCKVRTHVKTTGNAGTLQRLVSTVLGTDGHETRHLNLGELDLAATEGSQRLFMLGLNSH